MIGKKHPRPSSGNIPGQRDIGFVLIEKRDEKDAGMNEQTHLLKCCCCRSVRTFLAGVFHMKFQNNVFESERGKLAFGDFNKLATYVWQRCFIRISD